MKTFRLFAFALLGLALTTPAPPAAATPVVGEQTPAATPARTCAVDSIVKKEATRFDFTMAFRVRHYPADSVEYSVAVADSATLPSRFVRVRFRVTPEAKLVKVPLIYRGYMKRAYGRGWHPDFTYVTSPAYRAYTYLPLASVPAGLVA